MGLLAKALQGLGSGMQTAGGLYGEMAMYEHKAKFRDKYDQLREERAEQRKIAGEKRAIENIGATAEAEAQSKINVEDKYGPQLSSIEAQKQKDMALARAAGEEAVYDVYGEKRANRKLKEEKASMLNTAETEDEISAMRAPAAAKAALAKKELDLEFDQKLAKYKHDLESSDPEVQKETMYAVQQIVEDYINEADKWNLFGMRDDDINFDDYGGKDALMNRMKLKVQDAVMNGTHNELLNLIDPKAKNFNVDAFLAADVSTGKSSGTSTPTTTPASSTATPAAAQQTSTSSGAAQNQNLKAVDFNSPTFDANAWAKQVSVAENTTQDVLAAEILADPKAPLALRRWAQEYQRLSIVN